MEITSKKYWIQKVTKTFNRFDNRIKRDVELSPEDMLTILTLWENERQRQPNWNELENEREEEYNPYNQEENWLDNPVYPHVTSHNKPSSNYYYEKDPQVYDKRGTWGGFSDYKKKRFMVARKRNDPTRELRYLNGPIQNRNDYYTIAQLLGAQREPNVPVYRRFML